MSNVKLTNVNRTCVNPSSPPNLQHRKLHRLEQEIVSIQDSVNSMDKGSDNTCKLQLHQDQLLDLKRELNLSAIKAMLSCVFCKITCMF